MPTEEPSLRPWQEDFFITMLEEPIPSIDAPASLATESRQLHWLSARR